MPRTFFSKTIPDAACKYTFSHLRYLTFAGFFDGTPRVRAPAAPRLISQPFPLFHLLPSRRQYLCSFVCESTHKIATFREDLVTADDNGTNIRGNWVNYCLPAGSNLATPKTNIDPNTDRMGGGGSRTKEWRSFSFGCELCPKGAWITSAYCNLGRFARSRDGLVLEARRVAVTRIL